MSATSDFSVNSILDLNSFSNTIGSLAGSGTVTDSGAAATLTAGADSNSTIFSGLLQNGTGTAGTDQERYGNLDPDRDQLLHGRHDHQRWHLAVG